MSNSEELLDRQNPDGGWGYQRAGGSWTEPTCYATLALAAEGKTKTGAYQRGIEWLAALQKPDGGWSPRQGVEESTWVTAAVLLLPTEFAGGVDLNRASEWLLNQTGRESGWMHRLRLRLLGVRVETSQEFDGWPWFPGAAAWVAPTALSILALEKLGRRIGEQRTNQRLAQGRAFLLARRCRDGGWNHGSTRALGYDSDSYPETTGLALLALHAIEAPPGAVEAAERHLQNSASLEAASWLMLALLTRGRKPALRDQVAHGGSVRGTTELALAILAQAAAEGRNLFVS